MVLYGFPTRDERDTFEALIARDAASARSSRSRSCRCTRPTALRRCLADDDLDALMLVPGVGKRTAQRLLVELKARLEVPDLDLARRAGAPAPTPRAEVRDALTGLGYSPDEVRDALGQLPDDGHGRRAAARRAAAARGGPMRDELMRDELHAARRPIRSRPRRRRRCGRAASTSSSASPRLREHLEIMLDRGHGSAARPSTTCCSPARPASARRRLAGIIAAEMGARLQPTSGPALERAGDLAAILTNLDDGDVLFIDEIHRLPRAGRGGALSRDGGLPARHRDRQGPVGALDPPRPPALHARRRDDPHRPDHRSAARPLRLRRPPRLLRRPTSSPRSSRAPRRSSACRSSPRARARSRRALARHAPHREPAAEARARLRRGARRRHGRRATPRATRSRCSRSTSSASTRSTARSSARCAARSRAGRSGSARSRSRSARRRRRSRTCTSRSSCSAGCSSARRAAGSRRPPAFAHLGLARARPARRGSGPVLSRPRPRTPDGELPCLIS